MKQQQSNAENVVIIQKVSMALHNIIHLKNNKHGIIFECSNASPQIKTKII